MSEYAQCLNNHRNVCKIIDFEVSERNIKKIQKQKMTENYLNQNDLEVKIENSIYIISESYNLSLFDLYCTN